MKEQITHNPELQLAHDFVQFTGQHIFLTGRAGTGKTTFLHSLKEQSPKRMIVVAPTGVAAINARGVTIHSFFQLPFGPKVPGYTDKEGQKSMRFSTLKRNIIKSLDLLVIDEISMVRADLLDSIDEKLRRFRRNDQPFGGVQLLMIGDMQQLPPVVKDEEWNMLRKYYKTAFFFSSLALQKTNYITITLQHVYRQRDPHFIDILNKIRDKQIDQKSIDLLNERYKPGFKAGDENYIILTTHNAKAKAINEEKLGELKVKTRRFNASVLGKFPEYMYPTEVELELKVGSQVMFVKNDPDPEKRYFNGKIGVVTRFVENEVVVQCPEDAEEIFVRPIEWQNVKYTIEEQSKEIKEEVEGTFTQIPLKLAWAITIHKSQGLTFDRAIIDSESAFAHGQVYVALSRCRTLEGLVLSTPFSPFSLKRDTSIEGFNKVVEQSQPDQKGLEDSKVLFQQKLLIDLFTFKPLQHLLFGLYNVLYDNRNSIQSDTLTLVEGIKEPFRKNVIVVSAKFQNQIKWYLQENNNAEQHAGLQARIKKAAAYFSDQLQKIVLISLEAFSVETDNKEVRKKAEKAEGRLLEEAKYKMACLLSVSDGFVVKEYLEKRAKASLESPSTTASGRKKKLPVSREVNNPELYNLLKNWRDAKATELEMSHYMVVSLKSMRALSNRAPATLEELKMIHGFGRRKLESYGEEVLELINNFRQNHELKITPIAEPELQKKEPKKNTKLISFELWQQHKDVKKIAEERDFAPTTILGHLAHYVGTGELPVADFVDEKKLKTIITFFEKNSELSLTEAKNQLGDNFSYTDLRFVLQHLNCLAAKAE
ncbi:MAG: helix-turn-helix domain-containing protein [Bacteroidales bacterium]|nr:helix-turn-helix domain-containing protein [Bacteroidales bacterium]